MSMPRSHQAAGCTAELSHTSPLGLLGSSLQTLLTFTHDFLVVYSFASIFYPSFDFNEITSELLSFMVVWLVTGYTPFWSPWC